MILDTEFLGSLVEQTPAARERAGELDASDRPLRVPAMVVWELYYGVANAPAEERETLRTAYEKLFQAYPVVEMDATQARQAGVLRGRHARSDALATLDGADSAVATLARSYGEPVLSNDRDFRDVDGVTVEPY